VIALASARRELDAVLLLDKPSGVTSNAALQSVKRLLRARKAGHAGTLDPLASGLLPVLFGEATKFADALLGADKEYVAILRLGIATTTGDVEGQVIERRPVRVDAERVESEVARFRGPIDQVPPMYSALKRGGRPLYALAREGRTVERAPRRVTIHELEVLAWEGDRLEIRVRCSKGTYVRSLAEDLGRALGSGACIAALRRTRIAGFTVGQAARLDALEASPPPGRDAWLLPPDVLLQALPRIDLGPALAERFGHGQPVRHDAPARGQCRVYCRGELLLGIGMMLGDGELRPLRLVRQAASASG
jgi:tRNA pseudouridine55 synthase